MSDLDDRLKQRLTPQEQEKSIGVTRDTSLSLDQRLRERQKLLESGIITAPIREIDRTAREQFLSEQAGTPLDEPGLQEPILRADIGLSDTFQEKQGKFLASYPEGDFIQVFEPRTDISQRGQTILFRRHPDEDFAELDARIIDQFELVGDLADFSGEVPAIAMEALLIRGGSVAKQAWRATLGTLSGDAVKEAFEGARGFQEESIEELLKREAIRASFSAGGAGLGGIVIKGPINSLRGASSIALKESARAGQRAAKRLDVPPLLPGQVARSPFIQKMQGQASALFKRVGDYISSQQGAMARAMGRLREGDVKKILKGELRELFDEGRAQITRGAILTPSRSLTEGGTAIQMGIAEWDDLANMLTRWSYKRARDIEEPVFDLTALRSVSQKLKAGTIGRREGGGEVALSRLDPELEGVVDDIMALDPSLPPTVTNGMEVPAVDQLRALRTRLWDLKTPNPGEIARKPQADAATLYSALTKTMRDVKNASPEFIKAWRDADSMAKARFDAMEQIMVINAGKSETPALLAQGLTKPNQVDNLRVLKSTMPDSRWREFQESVRTHFIAPENIDNLSKRLETFDQPTLNALLTKSDQETMRVVGQRIDEFNQIGIKQALQKDASFADLIETMAVQNDTQSISQLVGASLKRPKLRRSIRAGLMERVWNQATSVSDEGVRTISRERVSQLIQEMRKSGAINFLERSDLRVLKEFETLAGLIPTGADSGTSLVAASGVSAATRFSFEGFRSLLKNMTIGRILTSPSLQRVILGKGKEPLPFNTLLNFSSFLGRELQSLKSEE